MGKIVGWGTITKLLTFPYKSNIAFACVSDIGCTYQCRWHLKGGQTHGGLLQGREPAQRREGSASTHPTERGKAYSGNLG